MRRTALLVVLVILAGLAAAVPATAAPGADKVTICHKPGTPAEKTITVALAALLAHAAHGDYLGECGTGPGDGTDPGDGTNPGDDETPTDACTGINAGSLENPLFQGNEVVHVVLDYPRAVPHVIWFHLCNADECATIMPLTSFRSHDEFDFLWQAGDLWEEGPITIGLDVRPAPESISITCSHSTGP